MIKKILGWGLLIAVTIWALNHQAHASHIVTQAGDLIGTAVNAVGNIINNLGV